MSAHAATAVREPPCCGRCGSVELRRSHGRTTVRRLVRLVTPLDRYACRTCGYRGWARGPFGPRHPPPGGRKAEARDQRLKRRIRGRAVVLAGLSLLLGVLAAISMQRCGLPVPPLE
jgi:ribosomal protein S27AE